jgi:hypothetical protein
VLGGVFVSDLHRLRAPANHGEVVAEPSLSDVGECLLGNVDRLARGSILGRPIDEARAAARKEALEAAQSYMASCGEPVPDIDAGGLVMAGHQPELFHPGVWVKNFALNGIARRHGRIPLNLVVDNDTAKSTTVRLPCWDRDPANVHLASVPFDHFQGEVPYEDQTVLDPDEFRTFPERAERVTRTWNFRPMLPEFWGDVLARHREGRSPGECFASARRAVERRWGCHNLEVPLSRLCRTTSFWHFTLHLHAHLPRFQAVYNDCVAAYRRRHGIRSRNHPVPDLIRDGDWYETPFWMWRMGDARRGRLMVLWENGRLNGARAHQPNAPLDVSEATAGFCEAFGATNSDWRVRSRALTTTMYARLCLADLFVHGLGGGKYDELTDDIIRGFFGIEPPSYLTLTATLHLPLPGFPTGPAEFRRLANETRDRHWNPQRHPPVPPADGDWRLLVEEKRALAASEPDGREDRKERFRRLRGVTERLRRLAATDEDAARLRLESAAQELQADAILRRRDYAFCLFPEESLRPFCTRFLSC